MPINLKHLLLDDECLKRLKQSGIFSTETFLKTDIMRLSYITALSVSKINTIITDFKFMYEGELVGNKETHNKSLQETNTFISTGLSVMDKLLLGGMKTSSIIEITGPPASGKTQLMNTVAARFCSSDNHWCFYIDTKMDFSAIRMERIAKNTLPNELVTSVLNRIKVQRAFKLLDLIDVLEFLYDTATNDANHLLVIDSLASLTSNYIGIDYKEFKMLMGKVTTVLRKLAIQRKFIVLVATIPSKKRRQENVWTRLPSHKIFLDRVTSDPEKLKASLIRNDPRRIIALLDGPEELMKVKRKFVFSITDKGCTVVKDLMVQHHSI